MVQWEINIIKQEIHDGIFRGGEPLSTSQSSLSSKINTSNFVDFLPQIHSVIKPFLKFFNEKDKKEIYIWLEFFYSGLHNIRVQELNSLTEALFDVTDELIRTKELTLTISGTTNFNQTKLQYQFLKKIFRDNIEENPDFAKCYPLLFRYIDHFKSYSGKPSDIDFFKEIQSITGKDYETVERTFHNYINRHDTNHKNN